MTCNRSTKYKLTRAANWAGLAAANLLLVLSANAVEYSLQPKIKVVAHHDDNIDLAVDSGESVFGTQTVPSAMLRARSETWDLSLDTELRFAEYNDNRYDSDDQTVRLKFDKQAERYSAGVNAAVIHDTTRSSETEDSGRFSNDRRDNYSLSPYVQLTLNEKNYLSINLDAIKTEYDGDNYTGFEDLRSTVQWTYVWSEQLNFFANVNASKTEFDERKFNTFIRVQDVFFGIPFLRNELVSQSYVSKNDGDGYQLGGRYQFSEELKFTGLFGDSDTESSYDVNDPEGDCDRIDYIEGGLCNLRNFKQKSSTELISITGDWKNERHNVSVNYITQTQPSSDGRVLETERATAKWAYRLSELNRVSLGLLWGENNSLDEPLLGGASRSDRSYYNVTVNYSHRFTERWRISATARYRQQEYDVNDDQSDSVVGRLAIVYTPQKIIW